MQFVTSFGFFFESIIRQAFRIHFTFNVKHPRDCQNCFYMAGKGHVTKTSFSNCFPPQKKNHVTFEGFEGKKFEGF